MESKFMLWKTMDLSKDKVCFMPEALRDPALTADAPGTKQAPIHGHNFSN